MRWNWTLPLWALAAAGLYLAECRGQAFVEHLQPPAVTRGKTTRLTLAGSEMEHAAGLWTSLPAGKLKATPAGTHAAASAAFDVEVAADCPLGLYGLRLLTRDGLSNVHLFLVDDLTPVIPPVDATKREPLPVALPCGITGTLREALVDRYAIEVRAGQRVTFEVVASRFGKGADPLVTIRDPRGRRLVERDNDVGLFFDCRFAHTFVEAGTYTVEVRDALFSGSPHWTYLLRMGNFPAERLTIPSVVRAGQQSILGFPQTSAASILFEAPPDLPFGPFYYTLRRPGEDASSWISCLASDLDGALEIEPNNTVAEATSAAAPVILQGCLAAPGDRDYFEFDLDRGQRFVVRGESRTLDGAADLELVLVDPDGREVQRVDDTGLEEGSFSFTANRDGPYRLLIQDMARDGGSDFAYRVEVRAAGPQLQLNSAVDALAIPQGSYQVVPLTVVRTEFKGPVELSLLGGPPGLVLDPRVIPEASDSIVCRLVCDGSVPTGVYTLQIAASATAGDIRQPTGNKLPASGSGSRQTSEIGILANSATGSFSPAGFLKLSAIARTQPLVDRQLINVDLIKYALREDQRRLPPSLNERLAVAVTPPAPFSIELPDPQVTLARFQQADLRVATTRTPGFEAPITFVALGGQVGDEGEKRNRVYARIPAATPAETTVTGRLHSRILSNEARERIDLSATAIHEGRKITLRRSFELDLKTAFDVTLEPVQIALDPGGTARLKLSANRLPSFTGPVTVTPAAVPGITLPEMIVIPADQPSVEVDLKVAPDFAPRKFKIRFPGLATVDSYEEENKPKELDVEVKKPEVKKP